jgi:hypothetical protein
MADTAPMRPLGPGLSPYEPKRRLLVIVEN